MATDRYNNIGKGIFVRFPVLKPACDESWWNNNPWHNHLLIVGESSYFPDGTPSVFKDPDAWYNGEDTQHLIPASDIPEDPQRYSRLLNNEKAGTKHVDRLLESMRQVSKMDIQFIFSEAMYYNYFLRPATDIKGNQSFKKDCKNIDREIAGTALCEIIDLDKPDIVIIVSKYAYDEFQKYAKNIKYTKTRIEFVYHPSRDINWSKPNGRQKFEELLRKYWIKGNK